MGYVQKALLIGRDGRPLIERLVGLGRELGLPVVLLGAAELGESGRGVPQLPDATQGEGPLWGLTSLLAYAAERQAVCLACDMPDITAELLARLATERPEAMVLAPRDAESGKWQPLFARYDSPRVAPVLQQALAEGERSFQGLLSRLPVSVLPLTAAENAALADWDTPEDMRLHNQRQPVDR
jgi:molybdopterin-guanine dinucleotide biosynthesis protein A